jgi:GH25 family lysozyme M1 (1,4-beta-N-acetylmuramidase)
VVTPAALGWGDPRRLTSADTILATLRPGHTVRVRNADCAIVFRELVRRLRAAGWTGPDAQLDEWGYNKRLIRSAEERYKARGLTESQWLAIAGIEEWSRHAWAVAVDVDTASNSMLATRPADPQAHTTLPVAACPLIAYDLGLVWGGSWTDPWDPQHFEVGVTPSQLAQIATQVKGASMYFADVSHYQAVDLVAYFKAHDRIALKVTEATGYEDPTFAPRYAYCRAHGHPAVLYHFDRSRFSGAEQFDWYLSRIRAAGGPRPFPLDLMCLDAEDTNNPAGSVASARAFTGRAAAQGYQQGSVYTGYWFADPHGITATVVQPGWRRLWLSDYGTGADASIRIPPGWTRTQLIARQFTDGANAARVPIPGIGYADYSRVLSEWTDNDMANLDSEDLGNIDALFRHHLLRALAYVMAGSGNTLYGNGAITAKAVLGYAAVPAGSQGWIDAAVSLNKLPRTFPAQPPLDTTALASQLAPMIAGALDASLDHLSDTDLESIAAKTADELDRRARARLAT